MTRDPISTAHQLACDALDLACDRADDRVLENLRDATIHLWYALNSSDDTSKRLDAAEEQLTAALEHADDEIDATLRTVLDQLCDHRSGGVA